jgi:hypothetical protein
MSTAIFKSRSYDSISVLYQILRCQHHLVQDEPNQPPTIPGLTPAGFAHWMTTWILAYPDQETVRLQKIVEALPINADGQTVDGKPERLPKVCRYLNVNRILLTEKLANISTSVPNQRRSKR